MGRITKLSLNELAAKMLTINHPSFAYTSSEFKARTAEGWYNECGASYEKSLSYYQGLCGI